MPICYISTASKSDFVRGKLWGNCLLKRFLVETATPPFWISDCAAGLGTLRGSCPGLTLGGSKVNFNGNFRVKGKYASRVARENSKGFVIFFVFHP